MSIEMLSTPHTLYRRSQGISPSLPADNKPAPSNQPFSLFLMRVISQAPAIHPFGYPLFDPNQSTNWPSAIMWRTP